MSIELPTIESYGEYSSDNYGRHSQVITIGNIRVFFSYKTPVAFLDFSAGSPLIIRENDWGPTTGKHLNWIDNDKSKRIPGSEFERLLAEATSQAVPA